jgi:hypothetical protein
VSRIDHPGQVRQREPRIRDKAYLGWIAGLPCVSCAVRGIWRTGVQVAHIKVGYPESGWRAFGHSEKSHDRHTVPLCPSCHVSGPDAQHSNRGGDERAWWEKRGIHPPTFCSALSEAYDAGVAGSTVVRLAARGVFNAPA